MDAAGRVNGRGRARLADSPRLFHNPVLDRLSRVHRLVPLFLYCPILVLLLGVALWGLPFPTVAAGLFGGYILWTLVEYFGHRFLFHFHSRAAVGTRVQFLIHGVHHDHPNDPLRLVMPPLMSIPIMAAAYGILRAGCGSEASLPAWAGFMGGYLFYDMLHYHVHYGRPRTALGKLLRHRHMLHHFRADTCSFGVSAPWWDEVFGTSPPARN